MLFNDIDFPNQLINSLKDGNLVIFAGAGASVSKPTNLPNFKKLTEDIAEGTGELLKDDDSCEVFLGDLKSKGIPVNELAAEKLSDACIQHNKLHEAITRLFPNEKDIKIVTTNYDKMFEKALEADGVQTRVYTAPALPLGDDVRGIVHIHGIVDEPEYMVLTDEDFGKAYLTEGYASRFLVQLFESYTVLFIGYSYNDIILRYLTRAMSRKNAGKKYILTRDMKSNWSALGICPVSFQHLNYDILPDSLVKLGILVKRGLLDWKYRLTNIGNVPINDMTVDAEIDYCLEDFEKTRIFTECIHDKAWIEYLDKKGAFDGCFSETTAFSSCDQLWAYWLCENFLGKEDDELKILICAHNNVIHKNFADIMIRTVLNLADSKKETSREYIVLCEKYLTNSWIINKVIELLYKDNFDRLCLHLFMKHFDSNFVFKSRYYLNLMECELSFQSEYYLIENAWKMIGRRISSELPYEVLNYVISKIEKIHFDAKLLEQSSKLYETWNMLVIEKRKNDQTEEPLQIMSQMYVNAAGILQETDSSLLRNILLHSVKSEAVLLCKIALKSIRLTEVFSPSEKLELILNNDLLKAILVKEQVFLLVAEIFTKLSDFEKNKLIDAIEDIGRNNPEHGSYQVYNWCVWIRKYDNKNTRVNKLMDSILAVHEYKPREHPELDIVFYPAAWANDQSPVSESELMKLPLPELVDTLKDFRKDPFAGPNRDGLLKTFSICISRDYVWTKTVITELSTRSIVESDIWEHVFYGLNDAKFKLSEAIEILHLLTNNISVFKDEKYVADYLWKIIQQEDCKKSFGYVEEELFSISEIIWNQRSHDKINLDRLIDLTLNTTTGILISVWMYMVSYSNSGEIPKRYKEKFEYSLKQCTWERGVSICVLAGYFNFLFEKDKEWSEKYILPFFVDDIEELFANAWAGYVHISGRINANTADAMAPAFLKALKHLAWFDDDTSYNFIELFVTLLIHVINKPTLKYIPEFYKAGTDKDIERFLMTIRRRLEDMDDQTIKNWWKQWLKHFLENRKNNKPRLLMENENRKIYELLPYLEPIFEEATDVICRGEAPKDMGFQFWYTIKDKKLASLYPKCVAKILLKLLDNGTVGYFEQSAIKSIVNELTGLEEKERNQLEELMLKNGIDL